MTIAGHPLTHCPSKPFCSDRGKSASKKKAPFDQPNQAETTINVPRRPQNASRGPRCAQPSGTTAVLALVH
ncbi:Inositol phosphorylceramide synthase catalytic subunit aur1 [Fusarium oxysporum f. sp. albedinis]|nr:Inositol phosphorylceramide synthase catalytic subunit aur1 [Fusarium oxysporum f. sp. albedinis]